MYVTLVFSKLVYFWWLLLLEEPEKNKIGQKSHRKITNILAPYLLKDYPAIHIVVVLWEGARLIFCFVKVTDLEHNQSARVTYFKGVLMIPQV